LSFFNTSFDGWFFGYEDFFYFSWDIFEGCFANYYCLKAFIPFKIFKKALYGRWRSEDNNRVWF